MSTEYRSVELRDAEMKGREFRGYAAVFDTPWSDRLTEATGYVERVAHGVFRKVLATKPDVPLLIGHQERHRPLATTGSGTLRLREDGKGLVAEATLPDTEIGHYAADAIERGVMRGMSYGISLDPKRDTLLSQGKGGVYTRTITRVQELLDVSLTWEPAYSATTVELRTAGFVATPLQELLSGTEAQTEDAATSEPPDDGKPDAWWGEPDEEPAAAEAQGEPAAATTPWWQKYADHLEEV